MKFTSSQWSICKTVSRIFYAGLSFTQVTVLQAALVKVGAILSPLTGLQAKGDP